MSAICFAPCTTCQRHVVVGAQSCPFCNAKLDAPPVLVVRATGGRLSRAAIFAGVTLGGCWTSTTPSTPATTPVEEQRSDQQHAASTGSIRGVVRIEAGGNRAPHVEVTLRLADGSKRTTKSDERGEYHFDDVPAGRHLVSVKALDKAKGSANGTLDFDAMVVGGPAQINVFLDLRPIPAPVKMPYGAPPVRRRVV
jgi:hypothetical protein